MKGYFARFLKYHLLGFPGGAVVESLPANAGDTGSCPGLGRSHMPQSGWSREPWPLSLRVRSLCSTTGEATTMRDPRTAKRTQHTSWSSSGCVCLMALTLRLLPEKKKWTGSVSLNVWSLLYVLFSQLRDNSLSVFILQPTFLTPPQRQRIIKLLETQRRLTRFKVHALM